jgi:hypothetical protein
MLLFANGVMAEDSILKDKKSFANDVSRLNSSENVEASTETPQKDKLSDHYKATFEKLLNMETPRANNALKACNTLIDASLDLESGAITQEQFSSIKRKAMILWNTPTGDDSEPSIEYKESYKVQESQNKSINCSSTTSGNTVYTNCR